MTSFPALAAGRRAAEALMRTTVRIERPTGETVTDPDTFRAVQAVELLWRGRGKVQSYEAYEQTRDVGGSDVTLVRVRVDIPVGACTVQPDDSITVEACMDDPALVGRVYRVAGVAPYKSMATAYRIFVEEVTRS